MDAPRRKKRRRRRPFPKRRSRTSTPRRSGSPRRSPLAPAGGSLPPPVRSRSPRSPRRVPEVSGREVHPRTVPCVIDRGGARRSGSSSHGCGGGRACRSDACSFRKNGSRAATRRACPSPSSSRRPDWPFCISAGGGYGARGELRGRARRRPDGSNVETGCRETTDARGGGYWSGARRAFRSARARAGRAPGFEVARGVDGRTFSLALAACAASIISNASVTVTGAHARRAGRDPLQELARVEELVLEALHAPAQRHVGLGFGVIPRRSPLTVHVDQRSARARPRGTTRRREDAWGGRDPSRALSQSAQLSRARPDRGGRSPRGVRHARSSRRKKNPRRLFFSRRDQGFPRPRAEPFARRLSCAVCVRRARDTMDSAAPTPFRATTTTRMAADQSTTIFFAGRARLRSDKTVPVCSRTAVSPSLHDGAGRPCPGRSNRRRVF